MATLSQIVLAAELARRRRSVAAARAIGKTLAATARLALACPCIAECPHRRTEEPKPRPQPVADWDDWEACDIAEQLLEMAPAGSRSGKRDFSKTWRTGTARRPTSRTPCCARIAAKLRVAAMTTCSSSHVLTRRKASPSCRSIRRPRRALIKNWTNKPDKGEPGSSKDPDQVTAWWTQWPNACVGLRTGKVNGIVVVDVDRHGHSRRLQDHQDFDGVDPKTTATVLSAGGGQHLYYAYAGELKSTTLGEGVDFLAEGRMVIAPGSVRADGKPYLFVNGHDLSALAPLPGSVLAKLKRSAGQQRLDDWSAKIEATPEGERHRVVRDACWSLAHDVVAGKLDETEFRSRIADMASTCRAADGPARRRELDRERVAQGARRDRRQADKPDAAPAFTLPDFEPADEPVPIAGCCPTSPT